MESNVDSDSEFPSEAIGGKGNKARRWNNSEKKGMLGDNWKEAKEWREEWGQWEQERLDEARYTCLRARNSCPRISTLIKATIRQTKSSPKSRQYSHVHALSGSDLFPIRLPPPPPLSILCRYRRRNGRPTIGIPRSAIIKASGIPFTSATTSYVPSCLRWFGHRSRAQRMLICFSRGLYLRIRRAVESMLSSMYLWPFVRENRLRSGRRCRRVINCFRGFWNTTINDQSGRTNVGEKNAQQ